MRDFLLLSEVSSENEAIIIMHLQLFLAGLRC